MWVFKCSERPHRCLELVLEANEVSKGEVLPPERHFVSDQGSKFRHASFEKRVGSSGEMQLVSQTGLNSLSTVEEYGQKLRRREPKMKEDEEADASTENDDDEYDGAGRPAKMPKLGVAGAADMEIDKLETKSAAAIASEKAGFLQYRTPTPKSKQSLSRSKSSRTLGVESLAAGSEGATEKDDKTSVQQPAANLSDSATVNYWISRMPLDDVLSGEKLGVSRHWAEVAAPKLEEEYCVELKGHVQLYRFAESLAPENLASTSNDDVKLALESLQGKVKEWPAGLQEGLWRRSLRQETLSASAHVSPTSLVSWWDRVRPFRRPDEGEGHLNIYSPQLKDLTLAVDIKSSLFMRVIGDVLVPFIKDKEKEAGLQALLQWLDSQVQSELETSLLDDELLLDNLMVTLEVVQALLCLLSEDLFKRLDGQREVMCLKGLQRGLGSTLQTRVANAMAQSAAWQERLRLYVDQVSAVEVVKLTYLLNPWDLVGGKT